MAEVEPAKLIISNLPSDFTTELLYDLFGAHGEITECDCKWGIGFVAFGNDDAAEAACKAMDDHEVKGKRLKVDFPGRKVPVQRLIVKNLPQAEFDDDVVSNKLREVLETHGELVEYEVKWGFGFIRYKEQSAVDAALKAYATSGFMESGKKIAIEIQSSKGETVKEFHQRKAGAKAVVQDEQMETSTHSLTSVFTDKVGPVRLFVGNLPEGTTEQDVKDVCQPIGKVKKIDLKEKYAFVHFTTPEVCREAMGLLGKEEINGNALRVKLAEIKPGGKMFIGNLNQDQDQDELIKMFSVYGNIVEFRRVRHFAFLSYDDPFDATKAVKALNGTELNGKSMKVKIDKPAGEQTDPNGCHTCGMTGHIAKYCPMDEKDTCHKCGGVGHWAKECKAVGFVDVSKASLCHKCGGAGHWAKECKGQGRMGGMNGGARIRSRSPPYGRPGYGGDMMGMGMMRPFFGRMGR